MRGFGWAVAGWFAAAALSLPTEAAPSISVPGGARGTNWVIAPPAAPAEADGVGAAAGEDEPGGTPAAGLSAPYAGSSALLATNVWLDTSVRLEPAVTSRNGEVSWVPTLDIGERSTTRVEEAGAELAGPGQGAKAADAPTEGRIMHGGEDPETPSLFSGLSLGMVLNIAFALAVLVIIGLKYRG